MKIGLYSELARRHIVMTREEIAAEGIDHRELRSDNSDIILLNLTINITFFNKVSRLFQPKHAETDIHVQEHRFTAIKIQRCLEDLGLKFQDFRVRTSFLNLEIFSEKMLALATLLSGINLKRAIQERCRYVPILVSEVIIIKPTG